MNWYLNLQTKMKLLLGFGAVLALMVGLGGLSISRLAEVNREGDVIADNWLPSTQLVGALKYNMVSVRRSEFAHLLAASAQEMSDREEELRHLDAAIAETKERYEPLLSSDEERELYAAVAEGWKNYKAGQAEMLTLSRSMDPRAEQIMRGRGDAFEVVETALESLIELNVAGGKEASLKTTAVYESARTMIIAIMLLALLIGVGLAFYIARVVSTPLRRSVDVLQAVADGDFTRSLDVDTRDEVGTMARALNLAVSRMHTALSEVRASADTTASSSQQLQSAATEISQGAQEQASSLEETAASLEEMTATVRQNAENAKQANQLASGAREVAEKGSRVVTDAVQAMGEINDASRRIADIITTIDEIAFQTNLLALNAAVEAARAGQQGRGFAVVAGEVRKLAARSASAAKEIKGLIQDSVAKVGTGTELVHDSGRTLDEIVVSVKRVADIVGEIAAASREQATGIEQVNRAITQMDQVTQANAGQTEELASTAEALSSQAEQLQALVGRFRLEAEDGFAGVARPGRAPLARPARTAPTRTTRLAATGQLAAAGAAFTHPANGNGGGQVNRLGLVDLDDALPAEAGAYVEY